MDHCRLREHPKSTIPTDLHIPGSSGTMTVFFDNKAYNAIYNGLQIARHTVRLLSIRGYTYGGKAMISNGRRAIYSVTVFE